MTREAFAVKYRNLRRFLTLFAACVVSLCAAAYLSFEAASQQEGASRQVALAAGDSEAAPGSSSSGSRRFRARRHHSGARRVANRRRQSRRRFGRRGRDPFAGQPASRFRSDSSAGSGHRRRRPQARSAFQRPCQRPCARSEIFRQSPRPLKLRSQTPPDRKSRSAPASRHRAAASLAASLLRSRQVGSLAARASGLAFRRRGAAGRAG